MFSVKRLDSLPLALVLPQPDTRQLSSAWVQREGSDTIVAVVLRVLDHLGGIDPLLRALVHSQVVFAEANLDPTGGGEMFKNLPQGEDDDVLAAVHVDDAGVAVGLARVVDEASGVALHRRVHHVEVVDAEHVAADALMESRRRG
ncbi:hypothetical protein EYF80_025983 [Liparis tanakae]|uniref:Uncharacterized protein n=1 Tax=Liparis tanakae TaxID=230148 RepID=A0A4Z2HDU5_9TELE|nr:hypothetical protein EYF80_025983 [Liparis tanakae]